MTFPADSRCCDSGIGGYDGHLQRKRVVEMCVISFHSTDCNQARVLLLGEAYQRLAIKPSQKQNRRNRCTTPQRRRHRRLPC